MSKSIIMYGFLGRIANYRLPDSEKGGMQQINLLYFRRQTYCIRHWRQIMKLVDMTCPHCGAALQLNAQSKQAYCSYCGALLMIDDGVQHIQFDNAEKAGYEFEKGRQRAQAETGINTAVREGSKKKKKRTWLWVLGWIFIFPVPFTILMARSTRIKPVLKAVIIAAAWITYLLIGILFGGENDAEAFRAGTENVLIQEITVQRQVADEETSVMSMLL